MLKQQDADEVLRRILSALEAEYLEVLAQAHPEEDMKQASTLGFALFRPDPQQA